MRVVGSVDFPDFAGSHLAVFDEETIQRVRLTV
jgi:hypothetical protein